MRSTDRVESACHWACLPSAKCPSEVAEGLDRAKNNGEYNNNYETALQGTVHRTQSMHVIGAHTHTHTCVCIYTHTCDIVHVFTLSSVLLFHQFHQSRAEPLDSGGSQTMSYDNQYHVQSHVNVPASSGSQLHESY